MSKIKRGRIGARIKSAWASPAWGRARNAFLFLGAGLALGLLALLMHPQLLLVGWRAPLQWGGAAWLFGLFVVVCLATDDEPRYARSGFWIRTASGAGAALGMALIFGAPSDAMALVLLGGAILGATGKYWLQGV